MTLHSPTTVFFDLDDTLFDHTASARAGLETLRAELPAFGRHTVEHLADLHRMNLDSLHARVLMGELSMDQARLAVFTAICRACGAEDVPPRQVVDLYRAAYLRARRPVPGALELLAALKPRVRIGVVTNNLLAEQLEKLRALELGPLIDVLVVSEEAGVAKPDPAIFRVALARAGCAPHEAVMVGDSWAVDVVGARAAGIRAVWLNRAARPCPEPGTCDELRALGPKAQVMELLLRPARAA